MLLPTVCYVFLMRGLLGDLDDPEASRMKS